MLSLGVFRNNFGVKGKVTYLRKLVSEVCVRLDCS